MNTRKTLQVLGTCAASAALLVGCSGMGSSAPDYDAQVAAMMKASFTDKGIAKVDRLHQDESDLACSKSQGQPLAADVAKRIEADNMKTVKMPSDGKFIGDWKQGEKLAQNGKGMTWKEKSTATSSNGGNCYNCHQITKAEVSYGTLGPSLYHYGKLRGVSDPASPSAKAIVEYTWGKLYNAKAYSACSGMPRFGHAGLLSEVQLQDLMALLLDPHSPVNQ
jgi:sulfur-oxidizing protein SoxX